MSKNLGPHNAATQLSVVHSSAIVGITQSVLQANVVVSGTVKAANISNKTTVTNNKVTSTMTVVLKF